MQIPIRNWQTPDFCKHRVVLKQKIRERLHITSNEASTNITALVVEDRTCLVLSILGTFPTTLVRPVAKGLDDGSFVGGCLPLMRCNPPCFSLIVLRLIPDRNPVESNCVRGRGKGDKDLRTE